jgi:hypothetical protein
MQTYGEANSELGLYGIDPLWREPNADGSFRLINWLDYERDSTGIYGSDTLLPQGLAVKVGFVCQGSRHRRKLIPFLIPPRFFLCRSTRRVETRPNGRSWGGYGTTSSILRRTSSVPRGRPD